MDNCAYTRCVYHTCHDSLQVTSATQDVCIPVDTDDSVSGFFTPSALLFSSNNSPISFISLVD